MFILQVASVHFYEAKQKTVALGGITETDLCSVIIHSSSAEIWPGVLICLPGHSNLRRHTTINHKFKLLSNATNTSRAHTGETHRITHPTF